MLKKINIFLRHQFFNPKFKIVAHIILIFTIMVLVNESTNSIQNNEIYITKYSKFYNCIIEFISIVSVFYFNLKILVPKFLLKGKITQYIFYIFILSVFILLAIIISRLTLFNLPQGYKMDINKFILNILANLISLTLIIISTSAYTLICSWIEYKTYILELETVTKKAELKQLKSQINPHFLFNTINNANIKAEKNPEITYNIITKLKDLLQYQFTSISLEKVNMKNEISFLSDYLELEKSRRSKFSYQISIQGDFHNLEVPPLLFIPFVENAVKHSHTTKNDSKIKVCLEEEKEGIYFLCENTKPEIQPNYKSGGLGLKNIKRRLDLLFGNKHNLNIEESKNTYSVNLYLKI